MATVFDAAGYSHLCRAAETPFNIVYEARVDPPIQGDSSIVPELAATFADRLTVNPHPPG